MEENQNAPEETTQVTGEIQSPEQTNQPIDLDKFKTEVLNEFKKEQEEAGKLAKMNEADKAKHKLEKAKSEIESKEKEIIKRELKLDAHNIINEKGLDVRVLDLLDYSNAENCKASIEKIDTIISELVQTEVEKRLVGKSPKAQTGFTGTETTEDTIRKAMGLK